MVIYAMTSSSLDDAPRCGEFLYNPNQINVATSRARALCIMVGSPTLFRPKRRSTRQGKMTDRICRCWKSAKFVKDLKQQLTCCQLPCRHE